MKGLATNAYDDGDLLFLSAVTAGELTLTAPLAPNRVIQVATVLHAHPTQGKLYCHPETDSIPSTGIVDSTATGRALITAANASAARTTLELAAAATASTPNTLVLRDNTGGTSFAGTVVMGVADIADLQFQDYQAAVDATFTYGAGAAAAHRTALGSGATGDALFTAATPEAARTTLELGNLATLNGPLAVASGGTGTTNGSITGTGALTFTAGGSNQNINLTPSGTGLINITGNSGNTVIPVFRATNNYSGGTVPGYVNTFECLAPNLSAGNAVYIPLGVSATTNNRASIVFYYAASGSSNNYMAFGSFFGATGVLAAFPNGGVAIAASGTPINPGAGCLSVSGNVGIGTTSPSALLDVNSNTVRVRTARTPASATAAGNAGDICWDANYIYVCVATNTWKRTAISTWP